MVAALRRPAGKLRPILSNLSLKARPPFFDLALHIQTTHRHYSASNLASTQSVHTIRTSSYYLSPPDFVYNLQLGQNVFQYVCFDQQFNCRK